MTGARLGPEFSFLVRCCRWNFKAAEVPRPDVPSNLDWAKLVSLARRHRVQGLAWNALSQNADRLPGSAKDDLSADARVIAATNLGIAAECRDLLLLFRKGEIPLLFVKGLSVGALAYRSPLMKSGWDIDLLIDPADLAAAAKLLVAHSYSLRLPRNLDGIQAWHRKSKESVWSRDDNFHVELHTKLADNLHLIREINVHAPRQLVEVTPGVALPTLAEDELLAYLAVHGASSAWFRLKWISDFAALLEGRNGEEIERLYGRSQELGAARASGQAMLLADMLFGVLRSNAGLRKHLSGDRRTRLLCQAALRMMTKIEGEPTEQALGTLAIHWTQLLLKPGLPYQLSEIRRQGSSLFNRLH